MKLPEDTSRYSHNWKYIELGHVTSNNSLTREMVGKNQPLLVEWGAVDEYRTKYQNVGLYTSVFHYNSRDLNRATRLGSLYFDLDSSDSGETSYSDALRLVDYLLGYIPERGLNIYFTGKKGFHIECEALCLGITPSNHLPEVFRYVANDAKERLSLTTLDFAVYDLRRMWRLPNSIHQHTGLYKRRLDLEQFRSGLEAIKDLAREPDDIAIPEQEFSITANEWYRGYVYQHEQGKQKDNLDPAKLLEHFNKRGSGVIKNRREMEFTPDRMHDGCEAIARLEQKAATKHVLEHEERLFLCSMLSYTEDSVIYLHKILEQCDNYNFEKSQAHIDDWIRRRDMNIGGRPYTCQRANEAGVGCGDCELAPRKKWIKVGDSWIESDEEVRPSPIRYCYQPKKDKDYENK